MVILLCCIIFSKRWAGELRSCQKVKPKVDSHMRRTNACLTPRNAGGIKTYRALHGGKVSSAGNNGGGKRLHTSPPRKGVSSNVQREFSDFLRQSLDATEALPQQSPTTSASGGRVLNLRQYVFQKFEFY